MTVNLSLNLPIYDDSVGFEPKRHRLSGPLRTLAIDVETYRIERSIERDRQGLGRLAIRLWCEQCSLFLLPT